MERRIFLDEDLNIEEKENYEVQMNAFAEEVAKGAIKGKKLLIISGAGISSTVPGMDGLMEKLEKIIDSKSWDRSSYFCNIYQEYKNARRDLQARSKLLTYVQNAYLEKNHTVQPEDQEKLKCVWGEFVFWLIQEGDRDEKGGAAAHVEDGKEEKKKAYPGLLKAEPTKQHEKLVNLYCTEGLSVVSITTNFDNLLAKAFKKMTKEKSHIPGFYPILDKEQFDRYYCSSIDDNSCVEIQSRGDAFWVKCTGKRNKICPNRNVQCYVPSETIDIDSDSKQIRCRLCGSEAQVYFAFPGTKEKDDEMSRIIDGVWKYMGNAIQDIVIVGSSMEHDPILVDFLREMIDIRDVRILYISRLKKGQKVGDILSDQEKDIESKMITQFLLGNYETEKHLWARARNTELILEDLQKRIDEDIKKYKRECLSPEEWEDYGQMFDERVIASTAENLNLSAIRAQLRPSNFLCGRLLSEDKVTRMQRFSQLGLKTYWLSGERERYSEHNRLRHSVGMMYIVSKLYLEILNEKKLPKSKATKKELEFLQLAALLHDIGHLPFSHMLEDVFDEFGWVPYGENSSFNHEQHTRKIVNELVGENGPYRNDLRALGYTSEDLLQLINGEFGVGYLDALINSPCDCDKIEYLHSDSGFVEKREKGNLEEFLKGFSKDLSINSENFLMMQEGSTREFLHLLQMRGEMYDEVYQRSGLRYLEACCKMIIRTFIVYYCADLCRLNEIVCNSQVVKYRDLSDCKIQMVIDYIESCLRQQKEEQTGHGAYEICEQYLLKQMVGEIRDNKLLSAPMKDAVEFAYKKIMEIQSERQVADLETEYVHIYMVNEKNFSRTKVNHLLKTLYLRFPGAILVDFVQSKSSFSFGKREKRIRRNDGTKSPTENILIRDINRLMGKETEEYRCIGDVESEVNEVLHYSTHSYINIYRTSEDRFYFMQASDFIVHELKKEGILKND